MLGTCKEITQRLKRAFGKKDLLVILVWTEDDIRDFAADITDVEARHVLEAIGRLSEGGHRGEGVAWYTIDAILTCIREDTGPTTINAN
ncbi:MAG: hypothetical protein XXXJIFNMEKO3_LKCDNKCA_00154 (plasmid) [Candidatus Erwinia impunctatus]